MRAMHNKSAGYVGLSIGNTGSSSNNTNMKCGCQNKCNLFAAKDFATPSCHCPYSLPHPHPLHLLYSHNFITCPSSSSSRRQVALGSRQTSSTGNGNAVNRPAAVASDEAGRKGGEGWRVKTGA